MAFPLLLSDIELMHAAAARPFSRRGWIFELKYSGMRVLAGKRNDQVQLLTRDRQDVTARFPGIAEALRSVRINFILDAQACILDERGRPDSNAPGTDVQEQAGPGTDSAVLFAFDLLYVRGKDLRTLPLLERKARLKRLIPADQPVLVYVDHIEQYGEWFYRRAFELGLDGVIGKRADAPYTGGRSKDWLRIEGRSRAR